MTLHYNKHLEIKNKWQNQQISKHFKNHLNYRWKDSRRERRCKSYKIDEFDMNDYQESIQSNTIPIWDCPYCTYKNIERKSYCNICNKPYLSNQYIVSKAHCSDTTQTATNMTLGQFCKNVWDTLSIPIWICSQCTYCNIEQLPKCQMCLNPYSYHQNQQNIENTNNSEDIYEIYEEYYIEDDIDNDDEYEYKEDVLLNDDTTIITPKCVQQQQNENDVMDSNKVKISVTIKLITNKLYQKQKSIRLQSKDEDILRHTLLEGELEIFTMNNKLIKSYSYIPAIINKNDIFAACNDNIIVPIKYKYRNRFGEFGSYSNNNPLKCVAHFIWKSQYPYLDEIECPEWEFIYPQNKNIRSPAEKRAILDSILPFLQKDIITSILFKYLGYDEIDIVKIHTIFDQNVAYFEKYKIKHFEKDLFMSKNNGKLPFTICANVYTIIKSRKINEFLKLTEIGYRDSKDGPVNNYWLNKNKKRPKRNYYLSTSSKYLKILYERYNKKPVRPRHDKKWQKSWQQRQRKKENRVKYKEDIKQFYPKKYLYLKHKRDRYQSRYRNNYYYYNNQRKRNDPVPWSRHLLKQNKLIKWYLQKDKRYLERKWSAYWKLNETVIC